MQGSALPRFTIPALTPPSWLLVVMVGIACLGALGVVLSQTFSAAAAMRLVELAIYGMAIGTAGLAIAGVYPLLIWVWDQAEEGLLRYQQFMTSKSTRVLDDIFISVEPRWLKLVYGITPLAAGALTILCSGGNLVLGMIATAVGLILPELVLRQLGALRKRKFQGQLVDALFMLSSSLKAGLSLAQAFEVLEAEMNPPASQEFGLVVKAHKVGRTFEEALQHLNVRMACEELNLMITAILVARETGGDVTHIINQLVTTIREKKKLKDKVKTLTLQGRFQAYIMSALPIFFGMWVKASQPGYFDILLNDPAGRTALATACGLWVAGMILLIKLSKVKV